MPLNTFAVQSATKSPNSLGLLWRTSSISEPAWCTKAFRIWPDFYVSLIRTPVLYCYCKQRDSGSHHCLRAAIAETCLWSLLLTRSLHNKNTVKILCFQDILAHIQWFLVFVQILLITNLVANLRLMTSSHKHWHLDTWNYSFNKRKTTVSDKRFWRDMWPNCQLNPFTPSW